MEGKVGLKLFSQLCGLKKVLFATHRGHNETRMIDTGKFDATKITLGEPKALENGPGRKCKFVPILYEGNRLSVKTPKCFCWSIQKNTMNKQGESYSLPLVMNNVDRSVSEEHTKFLKVYHEVVEACKKHCIALKLKKGLSLGKVGSCLYTKEDGGAPTLYAKVRFGKNGFITRFQKAKVKKGEDKMIDPQEAIDNRCEAVAIVCFESIYISSTYCTLQVKVNEAMLNFDSVLPELELEPEVEEGEGDDDEW